MASMLTPKFGRHSQITDFYNKLQTTDPNARDRASINHMTAVLLKNRQEREQYAVDEGDTGCVCLCGDFCSCFSERDDVVHTRRGQTNQHESEEAAMRDKGVP